MTVNLKAEQMCRHQNIVNQYLRVLTNVWRWRDEGVAQILFAALDKEAIKGGEALLPVVPSGETAPLFIAVNPGVEAGVSQASSIHACAFVILARAQPLILLGVWRTWQNGQRTRGRQQAQNPQINVVYLGIIKESQGQTHFK